MKLSRNDIKAIAVEVEKQQEEKAAHHWFKDKRKRNRVILVAAMILIGVLLEHIFEMHWTRRVYEVGIDGISDFLLFGSIES